MVKYVVENKLYLYKSDINSNYITHYAPITVMIGKFENYESDIKKLSELSGLKSLSKIIIKKNQVDYRKFYNERNKNIINELYKDDLVKFNYTF